MKDLVVVKYGSASVTDTRGMDERRLAHHAAGLARLSQACQLIIVSSGAVAAGRSRWLAARSEVAEPDLQTLAMMGSAEAAEAWRRAFEPHGLLTSQLLVTHREIAELEATGHEAALAAALRGNLCHGVVTVVNENDAVSRHELAKLAYGGDNDGLGSHAAIAMGARRLVLLTEAPGVLDGRELVRQVAYDTAEHDRVRGLARGSNGKGRGGMATKLEAAMAAATAGIEACIGSADADLAEVLAGRSGTRFVPNPAADV